MFQVWGFNLNVYYVNVPVAFPTKSQREGVGKQKKGKNKYPHEPRLQEFLRAVNDQNFNTELHDIWPL